MKKLFFLLLAAVTAHFAMAQAYTSTASYNKAVKPALALQLPYSEKMDEKFILDNLKKTGYDVETKGILFWKQNKKNGFYFFKDVMLNGMSTPLDLYFNVQQDSRKNKEQSTIYLLLSKGDENFLSPADDSIAYAAAKNFLNSFVGATATYKLDIDIAGQEKAVHDAENKLQKLQSDEQDMNRKIEELQKSIRANKSNQEDQKRKIESEKQKLAALKSKPSNQ